MGRIISKNWLKLILIFCTAFGLTLVSAMAFKTYIHHRDGGTSVDDSVELVTDEPISTAPTEVPPKPQFISLQPVVDTWAMSNPDSSIFIYDLDNDMIAAEYNADVVREVASIYKLFYVYDGYLRLSSNLDQPTEIIATVAEKGGDLDITTCLDLMVRESYNPCADVMHNDYERSLRVKSLIQQLELSQTSEDGLNSSARDIGALLQLIWQHEDINDEYWQQLLDSMLNQPKTTYDWRQGLPAGFSEAVTVYDKVGWYSADGYTWNYFNDAAFVVFPEEDRHYIIVSLIQGSPRAARTLAAQLEAAIVL